MQAVSVDDQPIQYQLYAINLMGTHGYVIVNYAQGHENSLAWGLSKLILRLTENLVISLIRSVNPGRMSSPDNVAGN